jgi:predicted dehydrogenase
MTKKTLKIGLIGVGCISENHLMSLSLIENNRNIWGKDKRIKLYALCDLNETRLDAIKKVFPATKYYTNGYGLINDPDIDVVYVLTPTKFHKEFAVAAAKKKKHVFVEKPLAMSLSEIDEMISARDQNKVRIQPGLVFRSAPIIEYLKNYIQVNSKKLGKPLNLVFRDSQWKPYTGIDSHASYWRGEKNMARGGILFEHTIHDIDAMTYIFGLPREIYAKIRYIAEVDGIEDSVSLNLELESGMIMNATSMWHNITHDERRFEVYFENAYIYITLDELEKKQIIAKIKYLNEPESLLNLDECEMYYKNLIKMPNLKTEIPGPYYYESVNFLDAIFNDRPCYPSLEIGRVAQEIIEKCYESSEKGIPLKTKFK